MANQSAFIDIRGVEKRFGTFKAVDKVDLTIGQGEFFSLLGPSGCGKTTLLRILGGLEAATSGRILIDGEDVTSSPPYRRPTNMVFQSYAIFPHLTVGQNIGYGLRRLKVGTAEKRRRIFEMLDLIGLPGYAERASTQLSGGQMQRVALARALVLKPKVLLLDEPLAALDKKLRERMQVELRSLQREVGITFIFVTHDQEEALTLSDRIAVMSKGKVLQASSPVELYERPQSRQIAEFVGEMNFFSGRVLEVQEGRITIDAGPLGRVESDGHGGDFYPGDKVAVAMRPERLEVRMAGEKTAEGIQCEIIGRAYFGNRTQLTVEVPGLANPVIVAVPNSTAGTKPIPSGQAQLLLNPGAAIILPEYRGI